MVKDDPQFRIRLPAELKARIEAEAKAAGRSLNAEIIRRLDLSLTPEGAIDFDHRHPIFRIHYDPEEAGVVMQVVEEAVGRIGQARMKRLKQTT